ncbi:hypothetical protein D9756_009066 [Leucocoprinus leucothites]|uniref:DUF6534 domain-containing protein n=1 Tax=Leucocoprinus leucothites TaxID=201217 RepID=A0A8H5FVD7_9AGAR|nr:hypothetical protein D9756_009066 [Leucoagaricus leucothites]
MVGTVTMWRSEKIDLSNIDALPGIVDNYEYRHQHMARCRGLRIYQHRYLLKPLATPPVHPSQMAPAPVPLPANASLVLGPPIVGIVLNWFFYGIFLMQYFMYLNNSRTDSKWLRAVVHLLLLLDTVQSVMAMDDLFYWFVYNFGDYNALFHFNVATVDGPFLDALIMFTVQLVYCWRLRELGRWKILPAGTAVLALVSCVSGAFVGINDVIVDPVTSRNFRPVEELWLIASVVTDIIIASSMVYLLLRYRKERLSTGLMDTLKRIVLLTLETNAATAVFAIALVLTFYIPQIAEPLTNVNIALGYIIGKLCYFTARVNLTVTHYHSVYSITMGSYSTDTQGRSTHSGQTQSARQLSTIRFNGPRTTTEMETDAPSQIPMIIGAVLVWFLYGILVVQYLMYLNNARPKDRKVLRGVVHFIFFLDTIQTLVIMDDVFFWFVYHFGDFSALSEFNLSSVDGPLLDAIIAFTVQLVYCWRVWVIGKWKALPIVTALVALAACLSGMAAGIHGIIESSHTEAVNVWLISSVITDILIAGSMVYLLMKYRTETASRNTMVILKRILLLTLETNALTAAAAIGLVIAFLVPSIAPPVRFPCHAFQLRSLRRIVLYRKPAYT